MKENLTQLYLTEETSIKVTNYADEHSTKLPAYITDHHAKASAEHPDAHLMISPLQAKYQVWFAKAIGAKRILEIGCFIGFSAMGWAEAVGPSGHVTTLEFSPEYAQTAEEAWAKHGVKNVEVIIGDARESLKKLVETITEPYDLVFIDADKVSYPTYLSLILSLSPASGSSIRLIRKDGIIMADNILRRGLVADSTDSNPWLKKVKAQKGMTLEQNVYLDQFNKALVASERVDTFLMPMFDGLGLGRLID